MTTLNSVDVGEAGSTWPWTCVLVSLSLPCPALTSEAPQGRAGAPGGTGRRASQRSAPVRQRTRSPGLGVAAERWPRGVIFLGRPGRVREESSGGSRRPAITPTQTAGSSEEKKWHGGMSVASGFNNTMLLFPPLCPQQRGTRTGHVFEVCKRLL